MKTQLETIIGNANELAEIAQCDIDCFGDDFSADSYRDCMSKIECALCEIEKARSRCIRTRRPKRG